MDDRYLYMCQASHSQLVGSGEYMAGGSVINQATTKSHREAVRKSHPLKSLTDQPAANAT